MPDDVRALLVFFVLDLVGFGGADPLAPARTRVRCGASPTVASDAFTRRVPSSSPEDFLATRVAICSYSGSRSFKNATTAEATNSDESVSYTHLTLPTKA